MSATTWWGECGDDGDGDNGEGNLSVPSSSLVGEVGVAILILLTLCDRLCVGVGCASTRCIQLGQVRALISQLSIHLMW